MHPKELAETAATFLTPEMTDEIWEYDHQLREQANIQALKVFAKTRQLTQKQKASLSEEYDFLYFSKQLIQNQLSIHTNGVEVMNFWLPAPELQHLGVPNECEAWKSITIARELPHGYRLTGKDHATSWSVQTVLRHLHQNKDISPNKLPTWELSGRKFVEFAPGDHLPTDSLILDKDDEAILAAIERNKEKTVEEVLAGMMYTLNLAAKILDGVTNKKSKIA